MKALLVLSLLVTTYAQARDMSCSDLGNFISTRYTELQRFTNPSCREETLPLLVENRNEDDIRRVIGEYGCTPLSGVEDKLNQLENEIALLVGFEKMKTEIAEKREEAGDPNLTRARRAAADFRRGLVTARALETLLATQSNVPIIRDLKALPVIQRSNPQVFRQSLTRLCQNREGLLPIPEGSNEINACSPSFLVDDVALSELNTLLDSAELSDQQLTDWSGALAITVGEEAYSFRRMFDQVAGPMRSIENGQLSLSRAELNAIKNLPAFQNKDALPILNRLVGKTPEMGIHVVINETKVLAEELKRRHLAQVSSRISWVLRQKGSALNLSAPELETCGQSATTDAKARECWGIIEAKARGHESADLRDLVQNLSAGMSAAGAYFSKLNNVASCLDNGRAGAESNLVRANSGYQFTDAECADFSTDNLQSKVDEARVLRALRERLIEQNQDRSRLTEFALGKFREQCRPPEEISSVVCEDPRTQIAPEAIKLSSDLIGFSLVHQNSGTPQDIRDICDKPENTELSICDYLEAPPEIPNVPQSAEVPSGFSPYTEVEGGRNLQREAVLNGLTGIGFGIASQLFGPRQQPAQPNFYVNPFPTNTATNFPTLSPADRILFNARYSGGYGYYFPTQGVTPYTSFPITSPYVQASFSGAGNSSAYFTNFGVYR